MKTVLQPALSRAQLVELMIVRLKGAGWKAMPCAESDRNAVFADLLPEPDEVLSLRNAHTGEQGQAALSFTEWNGRTSYACTLYRADGGVVLERGHLDEHSALQRLESRGELAAEGCLDSSRPRVGRVESPDPAGLEHAIASMPLGDVVAKPRDPTPAALPATPPVAPASVERRAKAPPRVPVADVGGEANALSMIVAEIQANGTYACRWAQLRRTHFPGPEGWSRLKDWCATQSIVCALSFGESSKAADVQFRKA